MEHDLVSPADQEPAAEVSDGDWESDDGWEMADPESADWESPADLEEMTNPACVVCYHHTEAQPVKRRSGLSRSARKTRRELSSTPSVSCEAAAVADLSTYSSPDQLPD